MQTLGTITAVHVDAVLEAYVAVRLRRAWNQYRPLAPLSGSILVDHQVVLDVGAHAVLTAPILSPHLLLTSFESAVLSSHYGLR